MVHGQTIRKLTVNETQACKHIHSLTNKSDIQKFVNEYVKTHGYVLNPETDYAANALMADANLKYHIGKVLRCAHNRLKEVN